MRFPDVIVKRRLGKNTLIRIITRDGHYHLLFDPGCELGNIYIYKQVETISGKEIWGKLVQVLGHQELESAEIKVYDLKEERLPLDMFNDGISQKELVQDVTCPECNSTEITRRNPPLGNITNGSGYYECKFCHKLFQPLPVSDFIDRVCTACENITMNYFKVPVYGTNKKVYRERVYCYELYHQLRILLGDSVEYYLFGEIDKSGHPVIEGDYKPDFIYHKPGAWNNYAVMEVKPITATIKEIQDDVDKIRYFVSNSEYTLGIVLIFGRCSSSRIPQNLATLKGLLGKNNPNVIILWHLAIGRKPILITQT